MTKNKKENNPKVRVNEDLPMPQGFSTRGSVKADGNDSYLTEIMGQLNNTGGQVGPDDPVGVPPTDFSFMGSGADHGSDVAFERTANQAMNYGGNFGQVSRVLLMYVDPLFDPILMLFPVGDRRALNERLRHYYNHHPIVGNLIDLHSEFPLSDFNLETGDPAITRYYNEFKERIGLLELMVDSAKDYWLLGEFFRYGNWDATSGEWESFVPLIPEQVNVHSIRLSAQNLYYLRPDPSIKKKVFSSNPIDQAIIAHTDPEYIDAIKQDKPFRLDNNRLLYMARKGPGDERGTSIVRRVLKDLVYEDKLRLLQYTFVDRHLFPVKIFKLGSEKHGWLPSDKHYKHFMNLLIQAANDPDFNILYHWGLQVEYIGTKDKIENLIPHFDWVEKRIMAGLFGNDALVHGQATNYATSATSMKILMHKYLTFRSQLERVMKQVIFMGLAKSHGFIKRTQAELSHRVRVSKKEYILPKYMWQKLNLLANTTQQEMIMRLRQNEDIPFKYVADLFGWDADDVRKALNDEKSTMLDKNYRDERKKFEAKHQKDYLEQKEFGTMLKNEDEIEDKAKDQQLEFEDDLNKDKGKGGGGPLGLPSSPPPPKEKEPSDETPKPVGEGEVPGETPAPPAEGE